MTRLTRSENTHLFQARAKADTKVFDEDADGMFARVEAPSLNLLRIWVCVQPSRLFESMAHATAVEALGLDPNKGVMVRSGTLAAFSSALVSTAILQNRNMHNKHFQHPSLGVLALDQQRCESIVCPPLTAMDLCCAGAAASPQQ